MALTQNAPAPPDEGQRGRGGSMMGERLARSVILQSAESFDPFDHWLPPEPERKVDGRSRASGVEEFHGMLDSDYFLSFAIGYLYSKFFFEPHN